MTRNQPDLHSHVDRLSDRELFVHALLGIIGYGKRVESVLTLIVEGARPRPPSDLPCSDRIYAVLGCISLTSSLRAELSRWRPVPKDPHRAKGPKAGTNLLR
jgi:hypothetical protein